MLKPREVLDQYYLDTRCQLLEIAATLDRYDFAGQGDNAPASDQRLEQIYRSLDLLSRRDTATDRSERLLNLYSDPA